MTARDDDVDARIRSKRENRPLREEAPAFTKPPGRPVFSIVYPTRHRPAFVREALAILERQGYGDFEVIVSDNFEDPHQSCAEVCEQSGLGARLRYVQPPRPVGMVENWSHALNFAAGEYVCFLTDKTFVLPGALERIARALARAGRPDLVSWTSDAYNPSRFDDYFGGGTYFSLSAPRRGRATFRRFSPADDLDRRGRAAVSRKEQTPADYARGKIAFGAYRRDLIERIVDRYGALFHNINPDYTSMVLGLSEAGTAIEMTESCVVGLNVDLSNGMRTDEDDQAMFEFYDALAGGAEGILPELLVPGVYASQHNGVAHDYVALRTRFHLPFAFDEVNWLAYIHEDVHRPDRRWSSPGVEAQQKGLLEAYLASHQRVADAVRTRLAERAEARMRPPPRPWAPIRVGRRWFRRAWPERIPVDRMPAAHPSLESALASRSGRG